jgi:hypothetical protein
VSVRIHSPRPPFLHKNVSDWSFDPEQPPIVVYTPPLGHPGYNFDFAGWHFHFYLEPLKDGEMRRRGYVLLWAVLHNPEHGTDYLSFHGYSEAPEGYLDKEEYEKFAGRKFAAAWLIAHWYEHYMHTCPCLIDDHKPTNFRRACINALLEFNP